MREAKSGKLKDKGVLNIQILITSKPLSPSKYSVNFWLKFKTNRFKPNLANLDFAIKFTQKPIKLRLLASFLSHFRVFIFISIKDISASFVLISSQKC